MLCEKVSKQLSEFFDGVLDAEASIRITQHLKKCENCRDELNRLSALHSMLNSLERVQAPDYLHHMVQNRVNDKNHNTWYNRFKNALEVRWSRIRTTEAQYYWTRALGTLMTTFSFCIISLGIDPFYTGYVSPIEAKSTISYQEYSEQFRLAVSKSFGRFPIEQFIKNAQDVPAVDDQWYILFGESISSKTDNDDLSVVTTIDTSGSAKLDIVLEYPDDHEVLKNLNNAISAARGRPAMMNGRTVSSSLPMIFNYIYVYSQSDAVDLD